MKYGASLLIAILCAIGMAVVLYLIAGVMVVIVSLIFAGVMMIYFETRFRRFKNNRQTEVE